MSSYFKEYVYLLIAIAVFLTIKATGLGVMLSDTNIYFVTSWHLAHGEILYRDVFFTNFPVFPYVSVLYYWFLFGDIVLYYFTASIEAAIVSILIFYAVYDHSRDRFLANMSSVLYLFSFLVISTTDHQTGVFLASIFAVLSYIAFQKKNFVVCGVLLALTILTKAYFLPVLLAVCFTLIIEKKYKPLIRLCLSGCITTFVVLLPFALLARTEIVAQVFEYSLLRGAGLSKFEIGRFFVFHDLIFFVLLVFGLISFRKHLFFCLFSLFSILFFLFYQDVYYLYLNYMAPFLAISFSLFLVFLRKKWGVQPLALLLVLLVFLSINLLVYFGGYRDLQRVFDIEQVVEEVTAARPEYIYGDNSIAPAVSYLTGIPQLEGIVDTNANMFRKGVLDAAFLTQRALETRTVIVTSGVYYPQHRLIEDVYSEVVNREMVYEKCSILGRYPVHSEGVVNSVSTITCYE